MVFSAISGWFGLTAAKKESIRTEINILDAINAHVKWKVRLQDYLNGASTEVLDPMVICRDDQCVLGKWIHGPAMKHFHEHQAYHTLRADHAQFHFIAGNVVKKVQEKDRAAADALMENEYAHTSRKVIQALNELNTQVMSE
jgi:methyl-accepting chemotaxis protein